MNIRAILAAATCLAMPLAAPLAASAQPVTGPYIELGGGTSILQPTHYSFSDGAYGKFQWRPAYAIAGGVGYGFGDGLRIQLDGNLFDNTLNEADSDGFHTRLYGTERKFGPMVNVLYDIPVPFPIVTPYVGGGAGYQWAKYYPQIGNEFTRIGGATGSFAYDLIGGVSYAVPGTPGLAITAEYRFTQLTQRRKYDDVGGAGAGTAYQAGGDDSSHTLLLGIRYQLFNPAPAVAATQQTTYTAPPAAPAPAPARTFIVFFDWDKYNLTPRATEIISEAANDSKTSSVTTLQVSGYTDTSGTPDYNMGLSERRAQAVASQLESDGVAASEIEIHAYGETHLLVQTGPGVREPQNRRVEIVLQ